MVLATTPRTTWSLRCALLKDTNGRYKVYHKKMENRNVGNRQKTLLEPLQFFTHCVSGYMTLYIPMTQ